MDDLSVPPPPPQWCTGWLLQATVEDGVIRGVEGPERAGECLEGSCRGDASLVTVARLRNSLPLVLSLCVGPPLPPPLPIPPPLLSSPLFIVTLIIANRRPILNSATAQQ